VITLTDVEVLRSGLVSHGFNSNTESAHGVVIDNWISVFSTTMTEVETTVSVTEAVKVSYMCQKYSYQGRHRSEHTVLVTSKVLVVGVIVNNVVVAMIISYLFSKFG